MDTVFARVGNLTPVYPAEARLLWDDQHLYVFVQITDSDVFSSYKQHDDPIWKADCVELFIDADGTRRGYVELQVNPNNAQFDAWFPLWYFARKAFFGHVPFPLVHIDTGYEMPELLAYRG